MSVEVNENQYASYPIFKGLQKPLEFMGFQGRYITWAACAVGGAILGFIIAYCILGFVVAAYLEAITTGWQTTIRKKKGSKKLSKLTL